MYTTLYKRFLCDNFLAALGVPRFARVKLSLVYVFQNSRIISIMRIFTYERHTTAKLYIGDYSEGVSKFEPSSSHVIIHVGYMHKYTRPVYVNSDSFCFKLHTKVCEIFRFL